MFKDASLFNQDLSNWCVLNISPEPPDFSTNSSLIAQNKPNWGSCVIINPNIYLDSNGITIKCPEATIGEKGFVNAKEYTVVDETTLRTMVGNDDDVTCVCTSLVTNTSELFEENTLFNQDVGSWDTSNVTTIESTFYRSFSIQSKYRGLGHFKCNINGW